jgi:hypothetical protein
MRAHQAHSIPIGFKFFIGQLKKFVGLDMDPKTKNDREACDQWKSRTVADVEEAYRIATSEQIDQAVWTAIDEFFTKVLRGFHEWSHRNDGLCNEASPRQTNPCDASGCFRLP